ncbi:MAG: DMT family transporter, partial [Lachnospiraceae bacterium]|nr:DMT family transporter [Lachnospiraceae bacterium]
LGLLSAAAMVLYNLLPIQLIHKYNTFLIVGWGMLIGGVFLSVFVRPWEKNKIIWDGMTITGLFVIIMFGTILAFVAYMEGVRLIGASKASLYAAVEPLTATVASVIFFHVTFLPIDFTGFLCIIAAVAMLSIPKNKK